MKRTFPILLLLFYLGASAGVTVHYNYCRGSLSAVSVLGKAVCPKCAAKESCGCCRSETAHVKTVTEVVTTESEQAPCPVTFIALPVRYDAEPLQRVSLSRAVPGIRPAPPPGTTGSLYTRYRSLLI